MYKQHAATNGNDILVVYFSRTGEQYTVGVIDEGNTAIVAKMIADKTIHLFATSSSTGIEGSLKELRETYPDVNITDGKRI